MGFHTKTVKSPKIIADCTRPRKGAGRQSGICPKCAGDVEHSAGRVFVCRRATWGRADLGPRADRDGLMARPHNRPRPLPHRDHSRPALLALPPVARRRLVFARGIRLYPSTLVSVDSGPDVGILISTLLRARKMDVNPYQSPQTTDLRIRPTDFLPIVDGKILVVRSGTVLPPVCVKTNQPVTEKDMVRKVYYWCSPLVCILIFLSPLILILAYFIARKRCNLTFGLHPDVRRKYRNRMLVKLLAFVALLTAIPFAEAVSSSLLLPIVIVLFLIALISIFIGNSPLSVTGHHRGDFSINGCSREFLASLGPEIDW